MTGVRPATARVHSSQRECVESTEGKPPHSARQLKSADMGRETPRLDLRKDRISFTPDGHTRWSIRWSANERERAPRRPNTARAARSAAPCVPTNEPSERPTSAYPDSRTRPGTRSATHTARTCLCVHLYIYACTPVYIHALFHASTNTRRHVYAGMSRESHFSRFVQMVCMPSCMSL